jgi:ATP-dependent Lon protease
LDREIAALTRKAARKIVARKDNQTPLTITPGMLHDYLGPPTVTPEAAERIVEYGIAIGLAWTPVGGEILFVEATRMPGKGALILTGSLGEVMKESAQTALSFLRNRAESLKIDLSDYDKRDIHIHVPAGATPKDGPSAGLTIVAALVSLMTRRKVRSDVAMTGEISLRGRVLRVGGIKEKVLAAARSGLKRVILPEQCRNDWLEVPAEVRHKVKAHFVDTISQMIPLALTPAR